MASSSNYAPGKEAFVMLCWSYLTNYILQGRHVYAVSFDKKSSSSLSNEMNCELMGNLVSYCVAKL